MTRSAVPFAALILCLAVPHLVRAQAMPTATLPPRITVFGGGSDVYTRLQGAKNIDITAGANYSFPELFHVHPSVELRGSYPISNGNGVSEKNFLGGIRLTHHYTRLHPYADALFGRGSLIYPPSGYFDYTGTVDYAYTSSNVIAFGGGVDIDLTSAFGVKFDGQYEDYKTPITQSGSLNSLAATAALVYRFDFDRHPHTNPQDKYKPARNARVTPAPSAAPAPPPAPTP